MIVLLLSTALAADDLTSSDSDGVALVAPAVHDASTGAVRWTRDARGIASAIASHGEAVRACSEVGPAGALTARFRIAPDGSVAFSDREHPVLGCIAGALADLRFDSARTSQDVELPILLIAP